MKPIRLILIPAHSADPAPWLVVGEDGRVRARGVLEPDRPTALEPMRTVAVAPGADVTVRWLALPPGSPGQVRAAAAWALRETLAAPGDRLEVAVGEAPAAGEPRLTAVVSRPLLQAWIDHLESLGVAPEVIVPDVLAVPEPDDEAALNAVSFGENLALRGRGFAATVQPELAELVAAGRPILPLADPEAVERGLIEAARRPPLNLLEGLRAAGRPAGSWRRAAALAAAVLASPLVLTGAGALRDDAAARRTEAETRAAIVGRFPSLAEAPDPVAALRRQAQAAPPPGGVGAAAAALFSAVERVEGAELDILIADPGEGVKATVSHPAYGDIETIRAAMIEAGMSVTVTGTADDAGRVVSDITIGAL